MEICSNKPEPMLMPTYHGQNVSNALEWFGHQKDTPVRHRGFKDAGWPPR